jgi:hypothetical protein
MKNRYRLIRYGRRGGKYYPHDNETGLREGRKTASRPRAVELLVARNEAAREPAFNLQKARIYLAASAPRAATRVWDDVTTDIMRDKAGTTLRRYQTAYKAEAYLPIKQKVVRPPCRMISWPRCAPAAPPPTSTCGATRTTPWTGAGCRCRSGRKRNSPR